jgi:hypothetical protein
MVVAMANLTNPLGELPLPSCTVRSLFPPLLFRLLFLSLTLRRLTRKVPELGGATTFTKADVFIRPKRGMATVFTYMTPDGIMDSGYTQHSGCPVLKGEKWIATAWLREGVTKEVPSRMSDPRGRVMDASVNVTHEVEQGVF